MDAAALMLMRSMRAKSIRVADCGCWINGDVDVNVKCAPFAGKSIGSSFRCAPQAACAGEASVVCAAQKASYTKKLGHLTRVAPANCANWTLYEDGNGFKPDGICWRHARKARCRRAIGRVVWRLGFSVFYVILAYSVRSRQ